MFNILYIIIETSKIKNTSVKDILLLDILKKKKKKSKLSY